MEREQTNISRGARGAGAKLIVVEKFEKDTKISQILH
jgi:hypothetical protein